MWQCGVLSKHRLAYDAKACSLASRVRTDIKEFLSSYRGEYEHCEVGGIFIMWLCGVLSVQKHADDAKACSLASRFRRLYGGVPIQF